MEVPGTGMKQGHKAPFFEDLQVNKANHTFFAVLFGDFSDPKFL